MTESQLAAAADGAGETEQRVRRHLLTERGAFEQARGQAAYRLAVALRKSLEQWIHTRAEMSRREGERHG